MFVYEWNEPYLPLPFSAVRDPLTTCAIPERFYNEVVLSHKEALYQVSSIFKLYLYIMRSRSLRGKRERVEVMY